MKYELSHHSSHICFKIKPEDVVYIVNNYKDVLESSNLYISRYSDIGNFSFNCDKFNVSADDNHIRIESSKYEQLNNFKSFVELNKVSEIEIDISCETILSFEFRHPNLKIAEQYSFRND